LIDGYFMAWTAEWSSISFGFPLGWCVYHYDLFVFGVPFFGSLSFSFLSYIRFESMRF
jgi:hypothetical protein